MKAFLDFSTAALALAHPAAAGALTLANATAGAIYEKTVKRRKQDADYILVKELRDAGTYEKLMADPDSFVSRAARYYQAAIIGSAHANLRILASLIVYGGERAVPADEFLYLAQTIESLRHDELLVLAAFCRARQHRDQDNAIDRANDLYGPVSTDLIGVFEKSELDGLMYALLRTGFLTTSPGTSGGTWDVTPQLLRLQRTTQLSLIIQEEIQPRKK